MLVSIIIVSRNSKNTIKRCLDSIVKQTYQDIEVVVVDSSDDGTEKIIENYKEQLRFIFKIIRKEPKGVGIARNTGIEESNGEVLIFVDADCWIDDDFVEKIIKPFNESEKVLSVYVTKIQSVQSGGIFPALVDLYEHVMHYDAGVDTSARISLIVVRKIVYDHIGYYDHNLKSGEDSELFNRLIKKKDELIKNGFVFGIIENARFYEEKQGLGFLEYYKRCIWYGEPLGNWKYFSHEPIQNTGKIILGIYNFILPFILLFSILNSNLYLFLIGLVPLGGFTLYFIYKSIAIGAFSRKIVLIPFFVWYKFTGLFLGLMKSIISRKVEKTE
ncbi:Glycosyltransferase AglI [uncultured archaeon]|nr:Glycosyltransferase AglI [uncultured archaeon]